MGDTYERSISRRAGPAIQTPVGVITYSLSAVARYYQACARTDVYSTRGVDAVCLAIPMQVRSIDQFQCLCEAKGVQREVSLFMMQDEKVEPGDFVLVHVGYAIQKISAEDAAESWQLLDEILAETV